MARPTKMTPETLDKLRYVFSIGGTRVEAYTYAKISESTFYDYLKEHLLMNPINNRDMEKNIVS